MSSREIGDVTTIRNTECEMPVPPALLPSFPVQAFILVHLFLVFGEGLEMACVAALLSPWFCEFIHASWTVSDSENQLHIGKLAG